MKSISSKVRILLLIIFVLLSVSFGIALHRENKVLSVSVGMGKSEIEKILGQPAYPPRVKESQKGEVLSEEIYYKANPTLWFGRWEDNLVVTYKDGVSIVISRVGL
jgi:hypothetical protein